MNTLKVHTLSVIFPNHPAVIVPLVGSHISNGKVAEIEYPDLSSIVESGEGFERLLELSYPKLNLQHGALIVRNRTLNDYTYQYVDVLGFTAIEPTHPTLLVRRCPSWVLEGMVGTKHDRGPFKYALRVSLARQLALRAVKHHTGAIAI